MQRTQMDWNYVLSGRVGEVGKAGELGPLSISRSEGAAMDGGGASVRMSKREGPVAARGGWDIVAEGQQMSDRTWKKLSNACVVRTSNRSWCSRTAAGWESKVSEQLSHDVHGIIGAGSVGGGSSGEVKKRIRCHDFCRLLTVFLEILRGRHPFEERGSEGSGIVASKYVKVLTGTLLQLNVDVGAELRNDGLDASAKRW